MGHSRTLRPMSLLVATQITAVATAILAAFALVTSLLAFAAFRGQQHETELLRKQVGDQQAERTRDAAERCRAQATTARRRYGAPLRAVRSPCKKPGAFRSAAASTPSNAPLWTARARKSTGMTVATVA
jgi:hypothetical protein